MAASAQAANVAGNHHDKYGSRNPISRMLVSGFLAAFDDMARKAAPATAFEAGCGEGELSLRLEAMGIETRGCDIDAGIVALANLRAGARRFHVGSVMALGDGEVSADLLVCCEVLEHVADPETALARLAAQDCRHILLSVPNEPVWRAMNMARGAYLRDWGNTPGHVQHWSPSGFAALVSRRLEVLERAEPIPWTMLLCRPRASG
jgi:2-polyprenyl-3-methyl-5-hydroxy-6-metoxy-1,4-benzoquinol methylase